jgi:cytidyltransferase-like protein|tara:strand:+ start:971 stop:2254 length:1284 start_codon:yes stop_codon:yes gene_type:complete
MKSFFQFLSESAAQQAARLGLQGDGHGGWYDRSTKEFVAKTEKGRLKFYNKRQQVGKGDPDQTELEKNVSDPNFTDPGLKQEPQQVAAEPEAAPAPAQPAVELNPDLAAGPAKAAKSKGTLTIAFGRFNPPHIGHQQLMDTAKAAADQEQGDYIIVPSRSNDPKKNPLDADTKVAFMRGMFQQHAGRIQNDVNTRTIFDVLKKAHADGYENVRIVGGADRVGEFSKLANNYNGTLYQFNNVEVISAGDRDPDAEGVEGLSASRLRLAAAENDYKTFRSAMPDTMRPREVKDLYNTLRMSMGINEEWGIWEMAPKFDQQTLRENYVSKAIFRIGEWVENMNTGLVGKIVRRGANHLICVTEDKIMFKSWIRDVNEAIVNGTEKGGVPPDQRLVGTDSHFRYVQSMVPGSTMSSARDFINKYKIRNRNR